MFGTDPTTVDKLLEQITKLLFIYCIPTCIFIVYTPIFLLIIISISDIVVFVTIVINNTMKDNFYTVIFTDGEHVFIYVSRFELLDYL